MPDTIYTLYWIHSPDHTDPFTEGYIGVTKKKPEHRWRDHSYQKDWWHDDIVCEVLHQVDTEDEVFQLEEHYRPEAYIGLNIKPGGKQSKLLMKEISKAKLSASMKGKTPWNKGLTGEDYKKHYNGNLNPPSMAGRIWITNGVSNRKIPKEDTIPDGWSRGRYDNRGDNNPMRKGNESKEDRI